MTLSAFSGVVEEGSLGSAKTAVLKEGANYLKQEKVGPNMCVCFFVCFFSVVSRDNSVALGMHGKIGRSITGDRSNSK